MANYLVVNPVACWVKFKYIVEASSEAEAIAKFKDDNWDNELEKEISDEIPWVTGGLEVECWDIEDHVCSCGARYEEAVSVIVCEENNHGKENLVDIEDVPWPVDAKE